MNAREQLDRWLADGELSPHEHAALSAVAGRRRMSLYLELHALLYLGVLSFAGGLAWTARTYAAQWSDAVILGPATVLLAGCFYYCFSRVPPWSHHKVVAPGLAFDYVLYLGCLIFAVELGYVEYRFELLRAQWDYYLLASSVLYLALAYRFDNRFVLSLGIATLGAWFGVRVADVRFIAGPIRLMTLLYGLVAGTLGLTLYRAGIKQHFLETYAHVAANLVLGALMSGVMSSSSPSLWTLGLIAASAAAITGGVQVRRFSFVVYGVLYGYIGLLGEFLRETAPGLTLGLLLIVMSAAGVIVGLVVLSRRFGREH